MDLIKPFIKLSKPFIERFPRMATAYRVMRDSRQLWDEPAETPMGFKMIGNRKMIQGTFEPEETEIVKSLLKHAEVFINVGANIGYYCCLALSSDTYTVAFEPVEGNLQYLYRNIHANHWERAIEIFPMALSNQIGLIEMYGRGTGASLIKGWASTPAHDVKLVPASTLDIVLKRRFETKKCLILVDIEGAEKFFLEGATFMLSQDPKPIWMVEISITEHQPKGIAVNPNLLSTFHFFWDHDYESWTADKHLRPVQADEIENIIKTGRDTLFTHNFLFIEKGKKRDLLNYT